MGALYVSGHSKPTIPPTGNAGVKPTVVPAGKSGRRSRCEPYREQVKLLLEKGLDAQRIWQDLRGDYGFEGSYDSVKRYIRREKVTHPTSDLPSSL